MATLTATVKVKNKSKSENPLWVVFRHQRIEVAVSTGENIKPSTLKKGKVVGEQAIALNELVNTIGGDLQKAFDLVNAQGEEVSNALVKAEYERVRTQREKALSMAKPEEYVQGQRIGQSNRMVYRLSQRIEDANSAIQKANEEMAFHQQRLAELTGTIPTAEHERGQLFVTYVQKYMDEKKNIHAKNTPTTYKAIITLVNKYNPRLRIQDVNRVALYELENMMIQNGTLNTTIENYTSKIKGICNHFASDLVLSASYKQYSFKLPIHDNDVLYLSPDQLVDFWKHEKQAPVYAKQPGRTTVKKSYRVVRDMFMFMAATSLRYVDLFNRDFREFIKTDTDSKGRVTEKIVMVPQKTRRKKVKVEIDITPITKEILERNNYQFKTMKDSAFRDLFREYTSDIPSFGYLVNMYDYCGQELKSRLKPNGAKYTFFEAIGAHTARRTWINFAFQSGYLIPEIVGVTGHTNMETLMVYASKSKVTRNGRKPLDLFTTLADSYKPSGYKAVKMYEAAA